MGILTTYQRAEETDSKPKIAQKTLSGMQHESSKEGGKYGRECNNTKNYMRNSKFWHLEEE